MAAVGGSVYFKVDGDQYELSSDGITLKNFQGVVRDTVAPGKYTEKDVHPEMSGTFIVESGDASVLAVLSGVTLTAELKTGEVAVLDGAYTVGDVEHDTGKGELKLTFHGEKGQYL
jgi:hypothetical protein